jgi:hypothetical protein
MIVVSQRAAEPIEAMPSALPRVLLRGLVLLIYL